MGVGKDWVVESAGTWTNDGLTAPTLLLQEAHRLGISGLTRHKSRQLTREILFRFNLVIAMENGQKEAIIGEFPERRRTIYLISEICEDLVYDIADPAMPDVDPDQVSDVIYGLIKKGAQSIVRVAKDLEKNLSISSEK